MNTLRAIRARAVAPLARLRSARGPGYTVRVEVRQRLLLACLAGVCLWYAVAPSALACTGLASLGTLVLLAFAWARYMATRVTAQRVLSSAAVQVGDELEEQLTLVNYSLLPMPWAEFVDGSSTPGYTVSGVRAVGGQSADTWPARTVCTQRGVFTLGPWELHFGDPFGLFVARQVYEQRTQVLIYPPLATLPPGLRPRPKRVGDRRALRQPLAAETMSATGARPYFPGDPLRRVDWRTTARYNKLFVKVFEPEASSSVWLIPDLDPAAHFGSGPESSFEIMIVLLASLASQMAGERLAPGLFAETATVASIVPQFGTAHFWRILHALALLQPVPARPLESTLAQARALVSERDSVLIVTASARPRWLGELAHLSRARHGGGVEVILLDLASFGAPGTGLDAARASALLNERGVPAHVVRREDVRPISGAYGAVRRWEFVTLATGRVIVRQTPRAVTPQAAAQ